MAKTLVKNKLGAKTHSFSLPCDATVASTFCASVLDGEYVGYSLVGTSGTDNAVPYNMVELMIKNTAGLKTYLTIAAKAGRSENDIYAALTGKTFNGVKADSIAITSMRSVA